jgi:chromosome segregation ATPase
VTPAPAPPAVDAQQAQDRLDTAERAAADARTMEQAANDRVDELMAEIEGLKQQLDAANRVARTARQARLNAERELASAQRRAARANR